jgi:hypothetical protein
LLLRKAYICFEITPLKRLGYIALLILILLQAGGLLLVYNAQQGYARYKMARLMASREGRLIDMELSTSEYQAAKVAGHDEICCNGKMYDIRSMVASAGRVKLRVINDTGEEAVIKKIKRLTGEKHNKEMFEQLMKLFAQVYTIPSFGHEAVLVALHQPYYHGIHSPIYFLSAAADELIHIDLLYQQACRITLRLCSRIR